VWEYIEIEFDFVESLSVYSLFNRPDAEESGVLGDGYLWIK